MNVLRMVGYVAAALCIAAILPAEAQQAAPTKELATSPAALPPAVARQTSHPPKIDLFDRFDDEQSPLEKGLLDARDTKWRKNVKLGPDPRCGRVIRELSHGKPKVKLCDDHGWSRETCVRQYCCENPVEQPGGDVVCTGPEDQTILACADALIDGGDTIVCVDLTPAPAAPGMPEKSTPPSSADPTERAARAGAAKASPELPSVPPMRGVLSPEAARAKECLDEIFVNNHSNHAADCLEDPDKNQDGVIDAKCRPIFEACEDMPIVTARRTHAGGNERAKRVHTRTEIFYERPSKMKTPPTPADEAWDPLQIRGALTRDESLGVPGGPRPVDTLRGAGSLDPLASQDCDPLYRCPENDDGDCVDRVTGVHRTDCFQDDGRLKNTLEWVSQEPNDLRCRHIETGDVFEGAEECLADDGRLATTLVQQIDEDGPDVSNKDGDCKLAGTLNTNLRSDCLGADGRLLPGYAWNVGEEACNGVNDDGDCLAIEPEQADRAACEPCPDPANCPGSCVRVDGWIGLLRAADDTCVLADGRVFARPNFKELVDEDCPAALDNDGDGLADEDPPGVLSRRPSLAVPPGDDPALAEDQARCTSLYQRYGLLPDAGELPDADHGCDLTRLMRVHVNGMVAKSPRFADFKARTGLTKFFDVDDEGRWCVDGAPSPPPGCATAGDRGAVNGTRPHDPQHGQYRFEERHATVDEVFAVKCKPARVDTDGDGTKDSWVDTAYDEGTGTCVAQGAAQAKVTATDPRCLASNPPPECRQAMMGFTFAPPVLEWGWKVQWRVCIFGFCFDIFYARIGYEFDLATGVRLPVEIEFEDLPQSAVATDAHAFDATRTSLEPKDFTVEEFRKFCQLHKLDAPWYIADCDRFSFPDFLDASDGDEFVAHYAVFAGLVVKVFSIPLINWAIDSAVDIPAMCTIWKMKDGIQGLSYEDLVKIELGLLDDGNALQVLKDNLGNCGSFTTPFGMEECPPWECSTGWRLRGWPFLSLEKHIRADCMSALLHDEVVTIKGQKRPICTGLVLGYQGASLGIGLTIEATAGSRLITAEQTATGDAVLSDTSQHSLDYTKSSDEPGSGVLLHPVTVDNYAGWADGAWQDDARIGIHDFTYYLNAIEIALSATLEFGGILEPIPDIGSFTLYNVVFDTGRYGIPIPQHPGTAAVTASVPVRNYGLVLDVRAPAVSPDRVDDKTLSIRPGEFGAFDVRVTNAGSVQGSFDNLACELSNRPYPSGVRPGDVLTFRIDPNDDHDCTSLDGSGHWNGDPYDGLWDDCYDASGGVRADRVELVDEDPVGPAGAITSVRDEDGDGIADEDPPDDWRVAPAGFPATLIGPVAAHQEALPVTMSASPFRHPLTRPGVYALRVTADSREAASLGLPEVDPLGISRLQSVSLRGAPEAWLGAVENPHVAFILVESFFDPQVLVDPSAFAVSPGQSRAYRIEGTNGANDLDALVLATVFHDSNRAGCDLADLGRLPEGSDPDCPYRATPTVIPQEWIVGALPSQFGSAENPLPPLGGGSSAFAIRTPADWAGMEDTTYSFTVKATSLKDPSSPPAATAFLAQHTVRATPESMTRYLGLEIAALIAGIEEANAQGIATAGLHPILTHPIQMSNESALEYVLAGNLSGAAGKHRTTVQTTRAFLYVLDSASRRIPEPYVTDWRRRANAILADLSVAIGG
jgi:hypothetical protein